jgi:translocation and assembly module TamA
MQNKYAFIIVCFLLFCSISSFAKNLIQIETTGVTAEVKKNIEASLNIDALATQSSAAIQEFFNSSPPLVKKALEPFGYFNATVHSALLQQNNGWIYSFQIIPGSPVRVRQLALTISGAGAADPIFQQLLHNLPLAKGQIFSATNYNRTKKIFLNKALAYGYFEAAFEEKQIVIDLRQHSAKITLHFNTGSRSRFGELCFNKNPYDKNFLKRYATFLPHDYYQAAKLEELQQTLAGSGYFETVTVNAKMAEKKHNEVPVWVTVKPRAAHQYSLGLGYGTDTGARGSAGFEWRRVTENGHRFKTELQVSQINSHLEANYIIPGNKPATDQFVLSAAIQKEDQKLGESELQKILASYVKKVAGWQQTIALTLQREHSTLEDQVSQTAFLFFPSIDWLKLSQDDPLRPSRGYRFDITLLGVPKLLGNTPFWQGKFSAKAIYPILQQDRVIVRASLNYTQTSDLAKVPLSFQFFAGGAQSIRGYSYNSIGPGALSWTGSLEYRRHILGNWYTAIFYDMGSVADNLYHDLNRSLGVGAVWQSPVGTLALSMAQAQDLPGKPILIQFNMGPDL